MFGKLSLACGSLHVSRTTGHSGLRMNMYADVLIKLMMLFFCLFNLFLVDFVICAIFHRIHRHALWIMGEYASSKQDILDVTEEIKKALGDVSYCFL